jgi:hypothetical protein
MMQRYGVLPRDLAPDAPIDFYTADLAYWNSFRYDPLRNPSQEDAP